VNSLQKVFASENFWGLMAQFGVELLLQKASFSTKLEPFAFVYDDKVGW
jgi:hypothetical protein